MKSTADAICSNYLNGNNVISSNKRANFLKRPNKKAASVNAADIIKGGLFNGSSLACL